MSAAQSRRRGAQPEHDSRADRMRALPSQNEQTATIPRIATRECQPCRATTSVACWRAENPLKWACASGVTHASGDDRERRSRTTWAWTSSRPSASVIDLKRQSCAMGMRDGAAIKNRHTRKKCGHQRTTGCALAALPPINGKDIVADTGAEKGTISHDAKRRPLQARVSRPKFVYRWAITSVRFSSTNRYC